MIITCFIIAFVAIFIFAKLMHKNVYLSTLEPLPAETTLLELEGVKIFEYREFGRATKWLNCKVRLSNKRVVFASKALLQSSYVLSGVLTWDEGANGASAPVGEAIKTGYVQLTTQRQSWTVEHDGEKTFLVIPVQVHGADALVVPSRFKVQTPDAGKLFSLAQGLYDS